MDKLNSTEELVEYAENIGLEIPADVLGNFNRIKSFIKQALGESGEAPAEDKKDKRVNIVIQTSETDPHPVFVGINGKGYSINRGEKASVPVGVVGILNGALKRVPDRDRNGRIVGWKEAQMYPFSVVE